MLAATGLRIGEAIKLDRDDIDWTDGVLLVRESKFGKSRYVPLHASTLEALERYARRRDELLPRAEQRGASSCRCTARGSSTTCVDSRPSAGSATHAGVGAGARAAAKDP